MADDVRILTYDPVPRSVDPELASWLERQFQRIQSGTFQDATGLDTHSGRQDNPHNVTHSQLSDVSGNLTHAQVDAELARLESVKLDSVAALQVFSFAAYGSLECPVDSAFPDLGLAFQKLTILTVSPYTPRGITINTVNSTFAFDNDGIYRFSVGGAIEHDEVNQGRETYIRIYDETDAAPLADLILGTGRNVGVTSVAASAMLEITDVLKGHVLSLQMGGGSSYTLVNFQALGLDINSVSEWREPLP